MTPVHSRPSIKSPEEGCCGDATRGTPSLRLRAIYCCANCCFSWPGATAQTETTLQTPFCFTNTQTLQPVPESREKWCSGVDTFLRLKQAIAPPPWRMYSKEPYPAAR